MSEPDLSPDCVAPTNLEWFRWCILGMNYYLFVIEVPRGGAPMVDRLQRHGPYWRWMGKLALRVRAKTHLFSLTWAVPTAHLELVRFVPADPGHMTRYDKICLNVTILSVTSLLVAQALAATPLPAWMLVLLLAANGFSAFLAAWVLPRLRADTERILAYNRHKESTGE